MGVSFTVLFDFFRCMPSAPPWLNWWEAGRPPKTEAGLAFKAPERSNLSRWKQVVNTAVWTTAIARPASPNRLHHRATPAPRGLLTGASPGGTLPRAQRFIRRITFRKKNDPVALGLPRLRATHDSCQANRTRRTTVACWIIPSIPRWHRMACVGIPTGVSLANIPWRRCGLEINNFLRPGPGSDFYMQCNALHGPTTLCHTSSFAVKNEIEPLAERSSSDRWRQAAISSQPCWPLRLPNAPSPPPLPFEPIDQATYRAAERRVVKPPPHR